MLSAGPCTGLGCALTDTKRQEAPKGGGLFEFQTPPPPDPPKVFEPVLLQFEILEERVGAKGAENYFFCPS